MQSVSYNGSGYDIPDNGDRTWSDLTSYLVALASGSLVKAGGSFVLTNDVNFGTSKGLIAKYFTSVTTGAATTGAVRLANTDSISFRNSLNTLDLPLNLSSDKLQFNSLTLAVLASTLTVSRALASDSSGNLVSSSVTATELGYIAGVTSAVQTQINTNSTNISNNLTTLTTHTGASTGVHGVVGAVVGTTDSQTLSTKTLTTPQVNGLKLASSTKTTTYTATLTDDLILGDATGGAFTVTLPAAASSTGKVITVKKIDSSTNVVTVKGNASELIDGANTTLLVSRYFMVTLMCDGTGWDVIARNGKQVVVGAAQTSTGSTTSATFATFSNTPTATVTAARTGNYKVYTNVMAGTNTTAGGEVQVVATSGSPTVIFNQSITFSLAVTEQQALYVYTIVSLTAGTAYTFSLQGKIAGGNTVSIYNGFPTNGTALIAEEI